MVDGVLVIKVAARPSPLSFAQVQEVWDQIRCHCSAVFFSLIPIETVGDRDKERSLREMEKSDFFTKEIDAFLLEGKCRIAIHSAKDMPEPLAEGLALIALTKGIESHDSLVLRHGDTLESLPPDAVIATSSARREEQVRKLKEGLAFCDLRGTIGERLAKLEAREADGIVVAEAALIRLELTHLNRIALPGPGAPLQGRLAVVARRGDQEMEALFSPLDARR